VGLEDLASSLNFIQNQSEGTRNTVESQNIVQVMVFEFNEASNDDRSMSAC
jgi:hypothetical protein